MNSYRSQKHSRVLILLVISLIHIQNAIGIISTPSGNECAPRKYPCNEEKYCDSVVCVCNAAYCDTLPQIQLPTKNEYLMYSTTKDGFRFKRISGSLRRNPEQAFHNSGGAHARLFVDKTLKHQKIKGFGGAFTDAAGINIVSLSKRTRDLLMKSYFSPDGLEYSMGRVPIAGSDFSSREYTYCDKEDPSLSTFNLTAEDFEYKIPLIKQALSLSPHKIKLLASAWGAPKWMKSDSQSTGVDFLKYRYYSHYAKYHTRFLDEYKKEGIEFWCLTTGNEPIYGSYCFTQLNAIGWNAERQGKWIAEYLGPNLKAEHPATCIIVGDDNRYIFPWWIGEIMRNKQAAAYISGSAVHWYFDNLISYQVLENTHQAFPNLFILSSEACNGVRPDEPKVALGSWQRAAEYAWDIITDLNHWVIGWIDWNMVLSETGGPSYIGNRVDAPIIANITNDEFYKQPMYYALGHFSKFIVPESQRINSTVADSEDIEVLAVQRPDSGIVLVILNSSKQNIKLAVTNTNGVPFDVIVPKESVNSLLYL